MTCVPLAPDSLDGMTDGDQASNDQALQPAVRLPERPLTLDDIVALAAVNDTCRYELDDGTLIIMPPPDKEHGTLVIRIGAWLLAHGYADDRVAASPGIRIKEGESGRSPDLVVVGSVARDAVWIEPNDVLLVVEIVSKGSEKIDRLVKPVEYAGVGIPWYWRVERGPEGATVHMHHLGEDEHGDPAYEDPEVVPLDKLLDGEPPELSSDPRRSAGTERA